MTPALPDRCVIAVLGATGTGKTQLAQALTERLAARGMAPTQVADLGSAAFDPAALAARQAPAIVLLMALDLPCSPDEVLERERADAGLRAALGQAGIPYAVIHGRGPERLAAAWNAILARAEAADGEGSASRGAGAGRGWSWPCEKCSEPACEHRLFSDLLAQRN
jgi:hypothetical protein